MPRTAVLLSLLLVLTLPIHAAETPDPKAPLDTGVAAELPATSETEHSLTVGNRHVDYTARAGMLEVQTEPSKPRARIFFVAYEAKTEDRSERPVTFAFNGGPGAASAYLHLGAMGPKRLALNADGSIPPPPSRLAPNEETWLDFTDLVFVDPVGTGFSDSVAARSDDREGGADRTFWGVRQDIEILSEFVRLYLTRHDRWPSPVFLVGESYGGFRVAKLSAALPERVGVNLNGIVLVSPVLELSLHTGDSFRLLPWALALPSYAMTTAFHGRNDAGNATPEFAVEMEDFALGDYLSGIVRGGTLGTEERNALFERIARNTGLPLETVRRQKGLISRDLFAKQLLAERGLVVSLYDGSITGIDPEPASESLKGPDPVLDALTPPFIATFTDYVRNELGYRTDLAYTLLNRQTSRRWDWRSGLQGRQGYAGAADDLKRAMTLNPDLKVLVTHGYYDLVTPYFTSAFVIDHMELPEPLRRNVTLRNYHAGHMLFTHDEGRRQFRADARVVYESARSRPEIQ